MKLENKQILTLFAWAFVMILIGSAIGSSTRGGLDSWYINLKRSPLTPPNYVFPIAWTILYALIGFSGAIIWHGKDIAYIKWIKILYIAQLILNWSWSPLFFNFYLTGLSFIVILVMDILVALIIYLTYKGEITSLYIMMTPYLLWLLFATYLNFYIWKFN